MIKVWWILVAFILSDHVIGQPVDSVALYRVDSLIKISRDFTSRGDFHQAIDVNDKAEKIALQTFGPRSAEYGSCIFNRGRVFHIKRDYEEAEKWYVESQTIREQVLGKEHPDYAWCLNNLANLFVDQGNFVKAEPLFLECKDIREKVLGKEHLGYVSSLNQLAILYWRMGQYTQAEPFWLQSKSIREKVQGKEHPDYATNLNSLANLYVVTGQFDKAELLYSEAMAIREKILGKDHPDYATSLSSLGILYYRLGQFDQALPLYLEAKAIREKLLGTQHYDYAASLINLAILYQEMGNYEKSEPLYIEGIAIRKSVYGSEHPEYAESINNLAILYLHMGLYEKAEPLYVESKNIWAKTLGKEHPNYASSLNNLAELYQEMGNYEHAESLLLESIDRLQIQLGNDHPNYAHGLNNLASLYLETGQYEKSEKLNLEALKIREEVLGKNHSDYALSLSNLASLNLQTNQIEIAEKYALEALKIREHVLGKDHPDYATSLHNLATIYRNSDQFEKAEALYLESKDIRMRILGSSHPAYISSLKKLASLYEIQSRYSESTSLVTDALALSNARMIRGITFLSEQELAQYAVLQQQLGFLLNSCLFTREGENIETLSELSYNQVLFEKGFLRQALKRLQFLADTTPESMSLNNELKSYQRRIAKELTKTITERKHLEEMEARSNDLEKELARTVAGYNETFRQVNWQEVRDALPANTVALEFIHGPVSLSGETDRIEYGALLLRPGVHQPQFIPLFEEKELNFILDASGDRKSDYVNSLYAWDARGLGKSGSEKKTLYELLWSKIEATGLENVTTIYYSPSGALHRLNIGAIAVNDETILSDHYNLVFLGSTRQLADPLEEPFYSNEAVLVGGVKFDPDTIQMSMTQASDLASRGITGAREESGTRGDTWSYLKWTEKEVERIATSFPSGTFNTRLYTGSEASEEVIKETILERSSPRVFHFATHGFFFPDPEMRNMGLERDEVEPVFKLSDNPMIRSGLILAGGNYAWQNGRAVSPDKEDGILTAYEISQMNLSNTELVVLSACETGLGDIKGNEGVYGLQRAFKIAGAKYLIMSLWQVPDRETMEFMTTFYKNWLESNMTIPDAFRKTQREMRDRFINPYSWAGFVLVE